MTPEERRIFNTLVTHYKAWAANRRCSYAMRDGALTALARVINDLGWREELWREIEDRKRR